MAKRRSYRRRSRRSGMAGQLAWSRPGAINMSTFLSSGTSEHQLVIPGQRGEEILPTRFTSLDTGSRMDPKIVRIICRVLVTVFSAVPGIIEYWYGLRILESNSSGIVTPSAGSIFVNSDFARREDWLWRGIGICQHSGAGLGVPVLGVGQGGEGAGIVIDCKPGRRLEENQGLVFAHGWRTQGSGNPPDATMQGTLQPEVLYWLPK